MISSESRVFGKAGKGHAGVGEIEYAGVAVGIQVGGVETVLRSDAPVSAEFIARDRVKGEFGPQEFRLQVLFNGGRGVHIAYEDKDNPVDLPGRIGLVLELADQPAVRVGDDLYQGLPHIDGKTRTSMVKPWNQQVTVFFV